MNAYISNEIYNLHNTRPLYLQYTDQIDPQNAYIYLDLEDGEITAEPARHHTQGQPIGLRHGILKKFLVNNKISRNDLIKSITQNIDNFNAILNEKCPIQQYYLIKDMSYII